MFGIKKLAREIENLREEMQIHENSTVKHRKDIQKSVQRHELIEEKVDENVERLNRMINELKGQVAQVRGYVKR